MNAASSADQDADGMDDGCEFALAQAFAPRLKISTAEGDYDAALQWLGGEYYYAVQPMYFDGEWRVRLAYLPAYYRDGGAQGSTWNIFDQGHPGDSEFIIEDVVYDTSTQRWLFREAFLSAHCGSTTAAGFISTDMNCQWWGSSYWDTYGEWKAQPSGETASLTAPIIWVARGSHANYYSLAKCDGGTLIDSCNGPIAAVDFPVTPGFNLGTAQHPLVPGNVGPRRGSTMALSYATENFWLPGALFRGWQGANDGETAYADILQQFGFGNMFANGPYGSPDPCTTDPGIQITSCVP